MIILNFHRVEPPTGFEITRLSPARFRRVLDEIVGAGLRPAQMWPLLSNPLQITFDDGFASICDHALPELQRRSWDATVFVITGAIGGRDDWDVRVLGPSRPMMTWEQVREWSDAGFEFGSHSQTHRDLTALSPRALREELSRSKATLEDRTGRAVRYLSYPFGRHDLRVREAVQEAGYEAAFAIDGIRDDRFAIPRTNVHTLMPLGELRRILQDGPPSWPTRIFAKLAAGSATVGNWRGGVSDMTEDEAPRGFDWGNIRTTRDN